jgi:dipeptidyl-peptidase 4
VAANRPFEMMEYPNRTHCICQGKGTQAHLFDLVTRFLDRNLMAAPPPAAPTGRERAAGGQ